ncbi:MAG: LptA/OstA family protein [Chthoniobacterales bacterium]
MIRRFLFAATSLLICSSALRAQSTPAATSTPAKTQSAKPDPTGLGGMQKDRPKNAKTEITCKGEATFDNASGVATFVTGVFVKDPQFNLYCDKLTVFLNKDRKGIEHAEAVGKVVIVQENTDEKGATSKSIGRAGKAVFRPATGEATLTDWPQLQQGINNHLSTEQTTIMILNRNGRLDTKGGSRTVIVDASTTPGQ